MSLQIFKGYKNVVNILKPQYTALKGLTGRTSYLARNSNVLYQQQASAATSTSIQQQRRAASTAAVSHSASLHWTTERVLATSMLALIPASILLETTPTDYLLATALVLHAHWGLQSILIDYIHGTYLPKYAQAVLYAVSILAFAGLCYFNYNDIGLSKAVKKLWKL